MVGKTYSTGSSIVMTLSVGLETSLKVAYSVVVLPLPVGPAQSTMPKGERTNLEYVACVSRGIPRSPNLKTDRVLSRIRMTQFSPMIVDTVATRTSTSLPSMLVVSCPSWGRRRSTMFMFAMILMRLTSPGPIATGSWRISLSAPSMRKRTRTYSSDGSM